MTYVIHHNGSGFDLYVVLKNVPQWRTNVSLIKNGSGIVYPKILNGYVDKSKKILNMFILDVEEFILVIL